MPDYIEVDHSKMTAKLSRVPLIGEVPYPVMMEPHLVVEYDWRYAKGPYQMATARDLRRVALERNRFR